MQLPEQVETKIYLFAFFSNLYIFGILWEFSEMVLIHSFFFRLIPESVRWLLAKGRMLEAKKSMKKIANFNNSDISENQLSAIVINALYLEFLYYRTSLIY